MADGRRSTREDPIPCPVRSADGLACSKTIPPGWTVDEGHGGGHMWMSDRTRAILRGGHFDATAALSGLLFEGHLADECLGTVELPCPLDQARFVQSRP